MARAAHRFLILQLAHVDGGSNKLLPVDVACTSGVFMSFNFLELC